MTGQLRTIWDYRYFWLSLVKLDLQLRYRRSFLGIGWSLLLPILMTAVFCVMTVIWFDRTDWRTFAPEILGGLAIWEFLRNSTLMGCITFTRSESYLRQTPLPLAIYSLRTVLGTAFHYVISMCVVLTAVLAFSPVDPLRVLIVLPQVIIASLVLFCFCWAIGVFAAFVTIHFQDIQHILEVAFQIGFFLTPIVFPVSRLYNKGFGWMADYSPAVMFMRLIREPLLTGHDVPLRLLATAMMVTAVLMCGAAGMFAWREKKVIFAL